MGALMSWELLALGGLIGAWVLIMVLLNRVKNLRLEMAALTRSIQALAENTAPFPDDAKAGEPAGRTAARSPEQAPTPAMGAYDARPPTQPERPVTPASALPAAEGFEQRLASRWLVWLGAVTVALGSAFLIRHSFEAGWLSPIIRVASGLGLAAILIVTGEWLRRQPLSQAIASMQPNYVPPALTGGGLFAAFASIYGAEVLYELLAPTVAFIGLAMIAFLGVALSLLQGPFIALLGLVGGFVTPLLMASDAPSPWPLAAYLLTLTAAGLLVVRYRGWPWLAYAVLAGAVLWSLPLLMLLRAPTTGQPIAMAFYLLSIAGLTMLLLDTLAEASTEERTKGQAGHPAWTWLAEMGPVDRFRSLAACLVAILALGLARVNGYEAASLATLFIIAAGYLAAGRWRQALTPLPVAALVMVLAALSIWHIPGDFLPWPEPLYQIEGEGFGRTPGPLLPPALTPFLLLASGFAVLFGLGGFVALFGAQRPGLWAGLSTVSPLLLLAITYWRVEGLALSALWASAALVLAALGVAAATFAGRDRQRPGCQLALGIYAAGTVAALSLAGVMVLEEAWLTVALSLQLPALAWLYRHLDLPGFRPVAAAIALVLLVRLVFNPHILDYDVALTPFFNWVLYGYGLPAIACGVAAIWFRVGGVDRLITLLEATMLIFGVLLITFQIRTLIAGAIDAPSYGFLERSLQSVAWLMVALALMWTDSRRQAQSQPASGGLTSPGDLILSAPVLYWGWRLLLSLGAMQVLILQLLIDNPLWSPISVGSWPIVNLLLLAYGLPAILACLFAKIWPANRNGLFWSRVSYSIGIFLFMVHISLELRHLFQGPRLDGDEMSNAEWYSYSALWLATAAALLGIGLWRANIQLRHAALVIVLMTVTKVFLFDAAALAGLFRVASFFGLGLCLIGIGYLYQRFLTSIPLSSDPQPET